MPGRKTKDLSVEGLTMGRWLYALIPEDLSWSSVVKHPDTQKNISMRVKRHVWRDGTASGGVQVEAHIYGQAPLWLPTTLEKLIGHYGAWDYQRFMHEVARTYDEALRHQVWADATNKLYMKTETIRRTNQLLCEQAEAEATSLGLPVVYKDMTLEHVERWNKWFDEQLDLGLQLFMGGVVHDSVILDFNQAFRAFVPGQADQGKEDP